MNKAQRDQMEREEYAEQAWEMRANQIKPPSFTAWKRQRARIRKHCRATLRNHYGSPSEAARGVGEVGDE